MDHTYIAEQSLIERYHRGLLDPEEEARFEEHFFGCPECTAELELARSFGRGMKVMAAEEAVQVAVATGLFAWLARRGRLAQAGIALMALLAVALVPVAWLAVRTQREADAVAAYRQQLQGEQQKTAALGEKLQASERGRSEERQKLEAQLAAAQKAQAAPAPWNEVLFNTPVLLLRTFRDAPNAAPATLTLPPQSGAVSLAVDAPADPRFTSYRVRLTGAGGRSLFEKKDLHANALEAVIVTFPPGFFKTGEYRLSVDGISPAGKATPLGSHPFRVVAARR
ncbi:MAG TPA: zf-HC2 domain-containing protein [Thermoanaerobaculia bacterium]|nr:zf-HC2 domain-containing protein [Thermoanaerobaculia bacterium]